MSHEHNHDHHNHDHEDEDQFINLTDEEGNVEEFEIVMSFEHEGIEFAVLYPVDESTGDEALIFKIVEKEDETLFENLTEEEFEIAAKVYEELVNENE
ncbi:MAG: DUF1292 domain-containing protein [Clostridiales bacterium]|nr:DUF1292 domain-containing protein [Clostridiales bacterium]